MNRARWRALATQGAAGADFTGRVQQGPAYSSGTVLAHLTVSWLLVSSGAFQQCALCGVKPPCDRYLARPMLWGPGRYFGCELVIKQMIWRSLSGWSPGQLPVHRVLTQPVAVLVGLAGARRGGAAGTDRLVRHPGHRLPSYLMSAIVHGLPPALAEQLTALTLRVVATSIVVHGISVTPLMQRYNRRAAPSPS